MTFGTPLVYSYLRIFFLGSHWIYRRRNIALSIKQIFTENFWVFTFYTRSELVACQTWYTFSASSVKLEGVYHECRPTAYVPVYMENYSLCGIHRIIATTCRAYTSMDLIQMFRSNPGLKPGLKVRYGNSHASQPAMESGLYGIEQLAGPWRLGRLIDWLIDCVVLHIIVVLWGLEIRRTKDIAFGPDYWGSAREHEDAAPDISIKTSSFMTYGCYAVIWMYLFWNAKKKK